MVSGVLSATALNLPSATIYPLPLVLAPLGQSCYAVCIMVPSAAARSQARVTVPERFYGQEESMKTTTALRQLLRQPGIIVAPGAYDCLTAKLIEREGFPAVYMTGAGTAVTRVGRPDLGFATLTEMLSNASAIAATISAPLIADADTGYGGALNVYRTVQEYARAGVAALHIEDQAFPKRCGHLDGKEVVPMAEIGGNL